ncbi:hypothetical protein PHYC_02465 [Phycisphaerales bacterium]|nr:hypothetical protein PHYC_02465 [Phycisphaerales bacterium]
MRYTGTMHAAESEGRGLSKPSRGRARRVAKWVGLVISVIVASAWIGSMWWGVAWWQVPPKGSGGNVVIYVLGQGAIGYSRFSLANAPNASAASKWYFNRVPFRPLWWLWWDSRGSRTLMVPLYMPTFVVGAATFAVWRRDRAAAWRLAHPRACVKCGYDRAGLDPAVACPECGAAGGVGKA